MDQTARRRRRNLIQNIAIALLSVSAVLLVRPAAAVQSGHVGGPALSGAADREGSPSQAAGVSRSGTVVLTDSYGRYGAWVHYQQ